MTVSAAINKLFFVYSESYPYYLDTLCGNEVYEEQEEVEEARKTLANAGIAFTQEIVDKKKKREANRPPDPTRLFERIAFKAIETDELPF